MPIRVLLEKFGGGDHGTIVTNAADKLNSDRKFFRAQAARDADRGQSTKIANAAERISKTQARFEVGVQSAGGDGKGCRCDHIELIEERIDFVLQHSANLLRAQIIHSGYLFVDVAGNLAERIAEFRNPSRFDQRTECRYAFNGNSCACCFFPGAFRQSRVAYFGAVFLAAWRWRLRPLLSRLDRASARHW